ncbi:MAG: peptide deformylase [Deltaproteobacteria bacterium]|nr:peptide deformylase [Deltaproteobacteria bacterium]
MLEIIKYPSSELKKISEAVSVFDSHLHSFLDELAQTMYGANGVGLAAPQVGKLIRAFVIDVAPQEDKKRRLYEFINPKIVSGEGKISFEEGCLSIPGFSEEVERKAKIALEYQDRFGNRQEMTAENLLAVAIQHENDHLDGILFIDRLSPLKRTLMRRKLSKAVTF